MAHDVFISYAHQNKSVADAVCATLEAAGIRCWIAPRDVAAGTSWAKAIVQGIEDCRVVVLVFSSLADSSPQVEREIERAVHNRKAILPFRIEGTPPTGAMEYFISTCHWLDALTPPLESHLNHLREVIHALLRTPSRLERAAAFDARINRQPGVLFAVWSVHIDEKNHVLKSLSLSRWGAGSVWEDREKDQWIVIRSAKTGELVRRIDLSGGFAIDRCAVTRDELFLEGEYVKSPRHVRWIKRIVLATGEITMSESRQADYFPAHEMLGMPIHAYHDLPWTENSTEATQPEGIQVRREQGRVFVTTPSHEMTWKAPEGDIQAVSRISDSRLLIGTSTRLRLLELRTASASNATAKGGRWYRKLSGGGDGRDWHVKCENCGYDEWLELDEGEAIPEKCPSCG